MEETIKYQIKIGELYISGIYLSDECADTYFISSLDLNSTYGEKFESKEVARLLEILENLGISKDSIVVTTYVI